MFAVIETGAKQYIVKEGTTIDIEKIEGDLQSEIVFDKVLLLSRDNEQVTVGQPYLQDVTVKARIINQYKDDKVIVFKFKPKTGYKRKAGHRQPLTTVRVESIQ
ncbi:50S ribosomal protein L21 [bacterium]|nr:50S ribosomal protein L21 [bacterium]